MPFAQIVPNLRTIPGVDVFDYRIPDGMDLCIGDAVVISFRRQMVLGLVTGISETSEVAAKTKPLAHPPIFRFGPDLAKLLELTAQRTFSSRPTVLFSWFGDIPKRILTSTECLGTRHETIAQSTDRNQPTLHLITETWNHPEGVLSHIPSTQTPTLLLTPWKHRADELGTRWNASVIHGDLTDTQRWEAIRGFLDGRAPRLVTTRLGAWICTLADCVWIDEPEQDDYKQEEQAPRWDARWIAAMSHTIRPTRALNAVGITPRLQAAAPPPAKTITANVLLDSWRAGTRSPIPEISAPTYSLLLEALEEGRTIWIIHPIGGDRSRVTCRDCRTSVHCISCGFFLATESGQGRCRACGRIQDLPEYCAQCQGTDFSGGRPGIDTIREILKRQFPDSEAIHLLTPMEFDSILPGTEDLIILTDLSRLSTSVEDIRRNERLAIAWRRVAAQSAHAGRLIVQGPEDLLNLAYPWLTTEGLEAQWAKELVDRASFSYPPAAWNVKILIDGSPHVAQGLTDRIREKLPETWQLRGPFPVPHRAQSRTERSVLHVIPGPGTRESLIQTYLAPFARDAYIDLDPIHFFC